VAVLRQLGFSGTDEQVVEKAGTQTPHLLSAASSASRCGWQTRRPSRRQPIRWMAKSI
jgi:succinylarginine dihydrolase